MQGWLSRLPFPAPTPHVLDGTPRSQTQELAWAQAASRGEVGSGLQIPLASSPSVSVPSPLIPGPGAQIGAPEAPQEPSPPSPLPAGR